MKKVWAFEGKCALLKVSKLQNQFTIIKNKLSVSILNGKMGNVWQKYM